MIHFRVLYLHSVNTVQPPFYCLVQFCVIHQYFFYVMVFDQPLIPLKLSLTLWSTYWLISLGNQCISEFESMMYFSVLVCPLGDIFQLAIVFKHFRVKVHISKEKSFCCIKYCCEYYNPLFPCLASNVVCGKYTLTL